MTTAQHAEHGIESVAAIFMLEAIQEWGQPEDTRIAAVQNVLDVCGFEATAKGWPVLGMIWSAPCEGKDGDDATEFLSRLTKRLKRGEMQSECRQVEQAIQMERDRRAKRKKASERHAEQG